MSKEEETNGKTVNLNQLPIQSEAEKTSHQRVQNMTNEVMSTIGRLVEEEELKGQQYTTFEIVDALLIISHGYNRRGLKMQREQQSDGR